MIESIKKRALRQSRILEGQMRGIQRMIDSEEYCVDIITQTLAIQKSLSSLNELILENHIRTHIQSMYEGGQQESATKELLKLYELTKNRGKS